jgi:uncharacterized glyoxalase superfamily protein PhnB
MTPPDVQCDEHYPTLAVGDVIAAAEFYTQKLGFKLDFTWGDPPVRAGVNLGDVSIHLDDGAPSPNGCTIYFIVGNADELFDFHRANGVHVDAPPTDRPWGIRDFRVRDICGYQLIFGHCLTESN